MTNKPEVHRFTAKLGNDEIVFETGLLAGQANGAVVIKSGECILLTTATASKTPREGVDFFPLSVDFEEKLYAAGRIPGSFFRREGRPSEEAILISRLTDRPLRPLFNKNYRNEVQVVVNPLSSDGEKYLDILSINSASAALMVSDIPWDGPIGAVRIGLVNDKLLVNPSISEMTDSLLDLRIAGTEDAILMVEAGADEISESRMIEAMRLAHEAIQDIIRVQKEMQAQVGKPKRELVIEETSPEVKQKIMAQLEGKIEAVLSSGPSKEEFNTAIGKVRDELLPHFENDETITVKDIDAVFSDVLKKAVRSRIIN